MQYLFMIQELSMDNGINDRSDPDPRPRIWGRYRSGIRADSY